MNVAALNDFGYGAIAGTNNGVNYAAIVLPTGAVMVLPMPSSFAFSAAIAVNNLLGQIPTEGLSGNNAIFANYFNAFSQENGYYFMPAAANGTLTDAVASAAPTRNGVSSYTAANNVFFMTNSLSYQLRQRRSSGRPLRGGSEVAASFVLTADAENLVDEKKNVQPLPKNRDHEFTVWFDAIASLAYQKAQSQTPRIQSFYGRRGFGF